MGATALVDKLKNFMGFGDELDEYEDDFEEVEYDEVEEKQSSKPIFSKKQKVVPMHSSGAQTKIVVVKPRCYNNSTQVADELKQRRPVIVNVGSLDTDEARRVIDFIAGTVYGLNGNMQKVAGGIFLATPSQVDILGEVLTDKDAGYEWSMF